MNRDVKILGFCVVCVCYTVIALAHHLTRAAIMIEAAKHGVDFEEK